jgi:uncharacterized protein
MVDILFFLWYGMYMDKTILQSIIIDQKIDFFSSKDLIERNLNYLTYIKTGQIVVITGARRCGKSSLLWLLFRKMELKQDNCLYFNGDDERLQNFASIDFSQLLELHQSMFNTTEEKNRVYFFDEIQNLKGWEKFLTRLYERGNKIFVTGSSANLLSSEMATSLTGRYINLHLHPFSFSEYLSFKNEKPKNKFYSTKEKGSIIAHWEIFFKMGGFPLVHKENNTNVLKEYYQSILYRDIVARYKINQIEELKKIGLFLFSNVGKLFSYKTLQTISGLGSLSTVKRFLEYWENTFMLFYVKKYDFSLKKQILNSRKVYAIDTGLIRQIGFHFSDDRGHLLENQIFNSLQRRNFDIYYHREKRECDFLIVDKGKVIKAIQVTVSLYNPSTRERELLGLKEAMLCYGLSTGYIITETEEEILTENGWTINIISAWKWLLEEEIQI